MTDGAKIISRNPRAAWRELDGQIVVVTPESGALHLLNGSASFLWKRLDEARNAEALADDMIGEYDTDRETALSDVASFAAEMAEKKVLVFE